MSTHLTVKFVSHGLHLVVCFFLVLCASWTLSTRAQEPSNTLLLVASSQLQNPFFSESVVLVTYSKSGPIGVILNRPTNIQYGTLEDSHDKTAIGRTLYFGGPLFPQSVVYVFKRDKQATGPQNLLGLGEDLYLGMGSDVFVEPLNHKPAAELKVFIGFSGWSDDQLDEEISSGDWLVLPFDPEVVFRQDISGLWKELVIKASRLSI